ncbi:MAG TPA: leucyl aminopeptidase [Caulobacteraceae bacterium]|nr:leucyl aminopeptidase [Caulobacteraceae bacterium]
MEIEFVSPGPVQGEALSAIAAPVFENQTLSAAGEALDGASGGALSRAMASGRFTGEKDQTLDIVAPAGLHAARVVLVGAGARDKLDDLAIEGLAAGAYHAVKGSGVSTLELRLGDLTDAQAARAALGVRLAAYRFDRYRTKEKPEKKPSVTKVRIACTDPAAATAAFEPLAALGDAVSFARDLVSEPANILYPQEFARRVKTLEELGLEIEILGEAEMTELGMGALLGVGQGSVRESQLAVLVWRGAEDPKAAPIAFVGKGVCFDTGGISLKHAEGMEEMKTDMGGAAAVAGAMHVLAGRKAKVNAVGILGLVENMPDGNAIRPGDILTSMSGQTIEVINTDAEGRLVLCDAIWYCQERFKPKTIIDLATLTGAIVVALGDDIGGLYANDETLASGLLQSSAAEAEPIWRMPLHKPYDKKLDSLAADVKNITGGRAGGSVTGALFLQRFVTSKSWAHLDIAPVAWKPGPGSPTVPEGASGFGVRLLNRLVADHYEDQ